MMMTMIINMTKTITAMLVSATRDKLRKRMMTGIEVGKIYLVDHKSRGKFCLKVSGIQGEWITGIKMEGEFRKEGEETEVLRRCCHSLVELKKEE